MCYRSGKKIVLLTLLFMDCCYDVLFKLSWWYVGTSVKHFCKHVSGAEAGRARSVLCGVLTNMKA